MELKIKTDNKDYLIINIQGENGEITPVLVMDQNSNIKYIAIDEISDENFRKSVEDMAFEQICKAASIELSLNFEEGWLVDSFETKCGISLNEDLSEYDSNVIKEQKYDWIHSKINPFIRIVAHKVYPAFKELPEEIYEEYRDDCFAYFVKMTI